MHMQLLVNKNNIFVHLDYYRVSFMSQNVVFSMSSTVVFSIGLNLKVQRYIANTTLISKVFHFKLAAWFDTTMFQSKANISDTFSVKQI